MSNHTPAPWTIDNRAIYGNRGLIKPFIASVEDDHNDHETEANALLIAAAPDLLALLREAHDAIATGEGDFSPSGDWFRESAAAINKATGVRA